jgi:SAM-dependent methyltransferase
MTDGVHVLTPEYYEQLSRLERDHWWWRGVRRIGDRMLDRIDSPVREWRVLDAGCGTGLTLSWIRRYTTRAPVGLDRAIEALRFCRAAGHRELLQADATALPFGNAQFNLALSLDVIQHLPRPAGTTAALAELARVLAPGGYLLLRTNSRCGYREGADADYYRYSLEEVRSLLMSTGFDCTASSYINCAPALAVTAARAILRRGAGTRDPGLPRGSNASRGAIGRLCYAWLTLEAMYVRHVNRSLPFGHSIIALARKRH